MAGHITRSFSLHPEEDADILEWWRNTPGRSEIIRQLLREHIEGENGPAAKEPAQAAEIDLFAIRQVFEAVLEEKLAGLALAGQADGGQAAEKKDSLAAFDDLLE